jgi:hypothetical protein
MMAQLSTGDIDYILFPMDNLMTRITISNQIFEGIIAAINFVDYMVRSKFRTIKRMFASLANKIISFFTSISKFFPATSIIRSIYRFNSSTLVIVVISPAFACLETLQTILGKIMMRSPAGAFPTTKFSCGLGRCYHFFLSTILAFSKFFPIPCSSCTFCRAVFSNIINLSWSKYPPTFFATSFNYIFISSKMSRAIHRAKFTFGMSSRKFFITLFTNLFHNKLLHLVWMCRYLGDAGNKWSNSSLIITSITASPRYQYYTMSKTLC